MTALPPSMLALRAALPYASIQVLLATSYLGTVYIVVITTLEGITTQQLSPMEYKELKSALLANGIRITNLPA
jgi:hypothetical protein